MAKENLDKFSPNFAPDNYTKEEKYLIEPFFTNLDYSVYVSLILSPELIGALCSRASRAKEDLRKIFLNEFIVPFLNPVKNQEDFNSLWREKLEIPHNLKQFIDFLHKYPLEKLFFNPKARSFYSKWLADYGDDSIAQMAGAHLFFSGISQVAIKFLEDQRIGIAPIEKSTRYIDYSAKKNGQYLYYTDPNLKYIGLYDEYKDVMDNLFITYTKLSEKVNKVFTNKYPKEPQISIKTKTFDILRSILPMSTLSQVAFFGNGQAFEYMVNRCAKQSLGELRWVAGRAKEELSKIIPAFLRRVEKEETREYQDYLAKKSERINFVLEEINYKLKIKDETNKNSNIEVKLIEYDPEGENKIIAGLIFPETRESWKNVFLKVSRMDRQDKIKILDRIFKHRKSRWYKVPRALENSFVRFEIIMDMGSWRDLQRHRMQTQQRQKFSSYHGYIIPEELKEMKFDKIFKSAVDRVEDLYFKIEKYSKDLAQYSTCFAHKIRFMQYQNLREFFWETELRSIPEGHKNYRFVEQEKFRLIQKVYPLLSKYAKVNMENFVFARRGQRKNS